MILCERCGSYIKDGIRFCSSCGQAVESALKKDAETNKGMAVLAYILFFIPIITGEYQRSPFVKYHTNQGTVHFIASLILSVGLLIVMTLLMLVPYIGMALIIIMAVFIFALNIVPRILGIMDAVNGKTKPLPVIGKYTVFK